MGQSEDDLALVQKALAGDQDAWTTLFQNYREYVLRICSRMVPQQAEDAAQDVWLHLQTKLQQYRGTAKFSTWLHSVTTTLVNWKYIRHAKAKRRPRFTADLEHLGSREPRSIDHDDAAIVLRMDMTAALSELRPHDRELLVRHYVQGKLVREIAVEERRSICAIKTDVNRCVVKYREKLKAPTDGCP